MRVHQRVLRCMHACARVCLQVVDDILDCTQTTEMLGKTAGKDVDVNKTTYPKLLGLEKSKQVGGGCMDVAVGGFWRVGEEIKQVGGGPPQVECAAPV